MRVAGMISGRKRFWCARAQLIINAYRLSDPRVPCDTTRMIFLASASLANGPMMQLSMKKACCGWVWVDRSQWRSGLVSTRMREITFSCGLR